ncbi:MAG: hypothetical protein WD749_05835 [Phycisphaerales bacterium]
MEMMSQLWLPILVSAAAVWIASALIWMALPHHRKDFGKLPDEAGFTAALRSMGVGPGNYGFPFCEGHSAQKDPEFQRKWTEGPTGFMTVMGRMNMGRNMFLTFIVYLVVSTLIAYLGAAIPLARGDSFSHVFRVLGVAGVLAYSFAFIPGDIWFAKNPRAIVMCFIDGLAYGLITGAVFAWLWPSA